METAILAVGLLIFVGHLLVGLFKKTHVPDVLVLTLLGICIGPYGMQWIGAAQMGDVGGAFSAIALIVILFEGGVNMDLRAISSAIGDSSRLTLTTAIGTFAITACIAQNYIDWPMAFVLGAVVAGTSSAVVIPMISGLKIGDRTRVSLALESALTDVLCIVVTYALIQSQLSGKGLEAGALTGQIGAKLVMASLIGFIGGLTWLVVLGKIRQIPNTQFTVIGLAFVLYGISELLGYSGAIAALVLGITIANVKPHSFVNVPFLDKLNIALVSASERVLFSEAVFLVKIFFFVYLGMCLPFSDFKPFLIGAAVVAAAYVFRLFVVAFSMPSKTGQRDAAIASIMIPKGLAAAVLATLPLQLGMAHGEFIRDVSFAIVFESILLTSILVSVVDSKLVMTILNATFFRRFADDQKSDAAAMSHQETSLINIFEFTAALKLKRQDIERLKREKIEGSKTEADKNETSPGTASGARASRKITPAPVAPQIAVPVEPTSTKTPPPELSTPSAPSTSSGSMPILTATDQGPDDEQPRTSTPTPKEPVKPQAPSTPVADGEIDDALPPS